MVNPSAKMFGAGIVAVLTGYLAYYGQYKPYSNIKKAGKWEEEMQEFMKNRDNKSEVNKTDS